jgi:hypothetical protein
MGHILKSLIVQKILLKIGHVKIVELIQISQILQLYKIKRQKYLDMFFMISPKEKLLLYSEVLLIL